MELGNLTAGNSLTYADPADAPVKPFRQFVVKIHSRCDLACDYCYVYEHVDHSWTRRPPSMPTVVVHALAHRIGEHMRRHDLSDVRVILHGGEPLLAGRAGIVRAVDAIRAATPHRASVRFAIQTNGVRLSHDFLQLFREKDIRVGVSLDGGLLAHNAHRRFRRGQDSFGPVAAALELLGTASFRAVYGGILCTIDLANDPLDVYHSLLTFRPPLIDFHLPHGNWVHPPPGRSPDSVESPYGRWLVAVFDEWYGAPRRMTAIRLFDSIIQMTLGGPSDSEEVGLTRTGAVTIDTDGSIQRSDVLKTTADGMAETGLNVVSHSFDEARMLASVRAEQRSARTVPTSCQRCEVVGLCGGGMYAHRFHPTAGFDYRSVYCHDLFRLIRHVRARVLADLSRRTADGAAGRGAAT